MIPVDPSAAPAAAKERRVPHAPLLFVCCLLLFASRAWLAAGTVQPNFDTATVGLMALDILDGARPLFYYGQNYMGAIEAYAAAGWFALLGPGPLALSLAPITFTVLWAAALWLLFRALFGRAAAWAGFAVLAIPGWTVLRVGMNAYGGYTVCYFFGTLAWFCAVRAWRQPSARAAPAWIAATGLCAGLALWTNFQSAVLVLMAATFLLAGARTLPPRRWPWAGIAAAAILFALAFSPVVLLRGEYQGGHVAAFEPTPARLAENLGILLGRLLPWMLHGRPEVSPLLAWSLGLTLAAAAALALRGTVRAWRAGSSPRLALAAPWAASVIFLLLYLPHPLASEGASRYLVGFWALLTAAFFALPFAAPGDRRLATVVLALWLGLTATTWVPNQRALSAEVARERADVEATLAVARATGASTFLLSHDLVFGHRGQPLSLAATNRLAFVSIGDERRQDRAEAAETADRWALVFPPGEEIRVRETLSSLGVRAVRSASPLALFAHAFRHGAPLGEAVRAAGARRWQKDSAGEELPGLLDQTHGTAITGPAGSGVALDLGAETDLQSIWMISPHPFLEGVPSGFTIELSPDGASWTKVHEVRRRHANAYTIGDRIYCNGFLGRCEAALAGRGRYLRLVFASDWRLEDLVVFAAAERPTVDPRAEEAALRARLAEGKVSFLAADRSLSARLRGTPGLAVFPRFNTKVMRTQIPREVHPGQAVAVPRGLRDLTRAVIERAWGPRSVLSAENTGAYTLLLTNPGLERPARRLCWNDHVVMEFSEREPLWR